MSYSITPRTGTAPLQPPTTQPWSTNWTLTPNGAPAAPQTPAAPGLTGDALQGVDGVRTIRETAQGGAPAAPQYALATPPRVEPPQPQVPSVNLTGSTQNRIDTLIGVQQGQVNTVAATLEGMGFKVDPKKASLGLTDSQRFYADLVGVLMGVEDSVKQTDAYKTLHQLYVSMPSQLSDRQIAELSSVQDLMDNFTDMITAANDVKIQINKAKADKRPDDVAWLESRLQVAERAQANRVAQITAELQRLNYRIDASKTSLGLTDSQQFYADLTGVFVGAEESVKAMPEYQTLHHLFLSMPSTLSDRQLANLGAVTRRMATFAESVKTINVHRVDLAKARADKNEGEVRRLEEQIARETASQRTEIQGMVRELQRLNYTIDPAKIDDGLSSAQKFYANMTGVLMGVEDSVKQTDAYKTLHHLFLSMPNNLSERQLAELSHVQDLMVNFKEMITAATDVKIQINTAKAEKRTDDVAWLESRLQVAERAQANRVAQITAELQRLNYQIDPAKIDTGISDAQKFYADIVGVLQGAEEGVKQTDAYKRLHQLYMSMPNDLSARQLSDLKGVTDRMKDFAETVKTINSLRVDISQARNAKDTASVARYERQIADLERRQNSEVQAMVADLERLNYRVDPNKTALGLTDSQRFYADLVGVLMGVEEGAKKTEAYRTLHQLYASMPNDLSARQIADLKGVIDRMGTVAKSVTTATEIRLQINQAKADKKPDEVARLEGRLKSLEREQSSEVAAMSAELQRLNYRIDPNKASLGLTGSQAFYADLAGFLTMAEDAVKQSESFKRLAQLYASMPSELSDRQLQQLRGLWAQIRGGAVISDQINALRVQLIQEQADQKR